MLAAMPAELFREWMYFWQIRPSGETAHDMRAAIVPTMLANMFRGKGRTAIKPDQFIIGARESKRKQTSNEIEAALIRAYPKQWAEHQKRKAQN